MSAKHKSGLGKSFESLIPSGLKDEFDSQTGQFRPGLNVHHIRIEDIKPSPKQPRRTFSEITLNDLARSIKTHGILQPIVVIREGEGYTLIAGERRWRAARLAGLSHIPSIVRTFNEQEKLEVSLIENLQREDLNALEMADGFLRLVEQFNFSVIQIAHRIGKNSSTVSNIMRLSKLPTKAKKALIQKVITEGHARCVLALEGNAAKQQQLLDLILRNHWSTNQAEQFVIAFKRKPGLIKAVTYTTHTNEDTEKLSSILKLKSPVKVMPMAKGRGRIIIEFQNDREYRKITDKLLKD